jgi:tetratricopeptide (TPR) repeat protein
MLNFRFLACLAVALAVVAVGTHFLHAFQVKRSVRLWLVQAETAEKEGKYLTAVKYLKRYLLYAPKDDEVLIRLGIAYDEHRKDKKYETVATVSAALTILDQALRRNPSRDDLRRRVVDLAFLMGDYTVAWDRLDELLDKYPTDGGLWRFWGDCERELRVTKTPKNKTLKDANRGTPFQNAADAYRKAIHFGPADLEAYMKLAWLYRVHLENPREADLVIDTMVAKNIQSAKARVYRATYLIKMAGTDSKQLDKAQEDLDEARKLAPQDVEILLTRAELHNARDEFDKARELLQQGLKDHPLRVELYLGLGQLEAKAGRQEQALQAIESGLKALPNEPRLLAAMVSLELRSGDVSVAEKTAARLEKTNHPGPLKVLLKAQILAKQGKWGPAAALLEDVVIPYVANDPILAQDVEMLLGQCHDMLGNPDQALLSYQQVIKLNFLSIQARLGAAVALMNLGHVEEAISAYRQILAFKGAPALRPLLVRALIVQTQRLPKAQRDWTEVKAELALAKRDTPEAVALVPLEAEVVLQETGEAAKARALLTKARDAQPDEVELWVALAELAGRDNVEDGMKVLDEAEQLPALKGHLEVSLARARFIPRLGEQAARGEMQRLESEIAEAKGPAKQRLLSALAGAQLAKGTTADAIRVCQRLAGELPDDLSLQLSLFDLQMQNGDSDGVRTTLDSIFRLEGKTGGPYWNLGKALVIVKEVQKQPRTTAAAKQLTLARKHLDDAGKRRWNWYRVPALQAEIDELEGAPAQALGHYREAVRMGDRRPAVLNHFVKLLQQEGEWEEVKQVLAKVVDQERLLAAGLGKVAAQFNLTLNPREALELAGKAVSQSRDYRDHLWHARILWQRDLEAEAAVAFAKARDLKPDAPEVWIAWVAFLARTGDDKGKQAAEAAIAEARKHLPAAVAQATIAACYQATGNRAEAEKLYLAEVRARPADSQALRNLAAFYVAGSQVAKAEPHLEEMLKPAVKASSEELTWARRNLAVAFANRGDYASFKRALALLEENAKAKSGVPDDVLARALVLSSRPERRKEAISLLKEMQTKRTLGSNHQFLLARLYEADGNWAMAQVVLSNLLTDPAQALDPDQAAFLIDRLLSRKELALAEPWLVRLEKSNAKAHAIKTLRAKSLLLQGKPNQALTVLEDHAQLNEADATRVADALQRLGAAAPGADKARFWKAGDDMYQRQLAKNAMAETHLAYAAFLGRCGRIVAAVDQCEQAQNKGAPGAAMTAVACLREGQPTTELFDRVEKMVRAEIAKTKTPLLLQLALADLLDQRGQYKQAAGVYRDILKLDANNVVALTNLAYLLALDPEQRHPRDGMDLLEKAVTVGGPLVEVVDTQGLCWLALGNAEKALSCLEQGVSLQASANSYFHLAVARLALNSQASAGVAFHQALALGLTLADVHPLEQANFRRLAGLFGEKKS